MPRFCDAAALKSRWGTEEVDRLAASAAGASGAAADAVIDQSIADAEAEALSYLLSRYDDDELPVTVGTTPAVLTNKVADLAIYELGKHQTHLREEYTNARSGAVSWLGKVQRGQVDLGLSPPVAADVSQPQILATKTKNDMVFGNGGLDEW